MPSTLLIHGRFPYVGIRSPCRPKYSWPNGAKVAVYIAFNIEHFSFGVGLGGQLVPHMGSGPDVLNYSWREYGNRVGGWRCLQVFDKLKLPVSVVANSECVKHCPELLEAYLQHRTAARSELVAHGRTNSERQGDLHRGDEDDLIVEATQVLTAFAGGLRPVGYLGPWISESRATPDLLAEHGYTYCLDWCMDDQPVALATTGGSSSILSVPYPQELNDVPAIMVRGVGAETFADMIKTNLDEMLLQAAEDDLPVVMGIALHGYIIGQPFRLWHLRHALSYIRSKSDAGEVWLATAGEIARHHIQNPQSRSTFLTIDKRSGRKRRWFSATDLPQSTNT